MVYFCSGQTIEYCGSYEPMIASITTDDDYTPILTQRKSVLVRKVSINALLAGFGESRRAMVSQKRAMVDRLALEVICFSFSTEGVQSDGVDVVTQRLSVS
jgi:hypothetical protein